jgi:5-methyltetrahydropteroyltriglutamate--homocysteine methyltransferase
MSVANNRPRADHVGSLLRPQGVKEAREQHLDLGTLDAQTLHRAEDTAIAEVVAMQESVGLGTVTDGEYRRAFWHYDFMGSLDGLDLVERAQQGIQFQGAALKPIFPTIPGRIGFPSDHPMLDHFTYLASVTKARPKISIPGPSCCHFRVDPDDITVPEYREDPEALFEDITQAYRDAVSAFYAAGCRYLQMDDIFFAYLCDPKIQAQKRAQGFDPDELIHRYARMMREAIAGRPDDMLIGMHMCRGNFQSTWVASGGYDPAADAVFNETGIDVFYMEYDSERAGGLEPLRLLSKGSQRVLPGFITTKTPELESVDDLKRRFDEASKYVDLDQLGIAPQCGFASTEEGNLVTVDDQRRKLELVVETAQAIWGEV